MIGLFVFAAASDAAPLLAALLVGVLLLVGGLLLFLLPRAEQRTPSRRWRPRSPVPTLPGYRIRREQANAPRQFLSVSRIAALAPRPAEPLPTPSAMDDIRGEDQTGAFLPSGETHIEEAATLAPPALESQQPLPLSEALAAREPEPAAILPEDAAIAPSGAEAPLQAEPTSKTLPPEPIPETNQPDLSAEDTQQAPGSEEEPTVSAPAPLIRKARLADVFAEPAIKRPYVKEAAPAAQPAPAPEPQPPQSAVRRAHLVGFPAPSTPMTSDPALNQPEPSEARQEGAAVSPGRTGAEADSFREASAGADAEEKAEEKTDKVILPGVEAASPKSDAAVTPAVRIVCFGTVDILLDGTPLSPLDSRFRASREFELLAFLAHSAALRRQSFVDRSTITEALLSEVLNEDDDELDGDGEEYRRSPLAGWKYRLCRRLRRAGLPDHAWLETRADGALRLRADVEIDLVDFLQTSSRLRKARDLMRHSAGAGTSQQIKRETVLEWLQQLQRLYRDRGEFAEQFKFQEWTQEPRRRYRNIYWHALFYAAELQANLGERQMAVQLAEELLEQEEVETEVIYEAILTWLHEDENTSDLSRWLHKYRVWYAATHDGRSLDRDRPELVGRLNVKPSPTVPVKKPSA